MAQVQESVKTSTMVTPEDTVPATDQPATPAMEESTPVPNTASGRYQQYDSALIDDAGYESTILFFYAAWCPECRSYDKAINEGSLPDGVQILRVTYDDAQDLRQKYGVTIQSTFVRVDGAGNKQTLWNGYGKDKSIDAIIENTK